MLCLVYDKCLGSGSLYYAGAVCGKFLCPGSFYYVMYGEVYGAVYGAVCGKSPHPDSHHCAVCGAVRSTVCGAV